MSTVSVTDLPRPWLLDSCIVYVFPLVCKIVTESTRIIAYLSMKGPVPCIVFAIIETREQHRLAFDGLIQIQRYHLTWITSLDTSFIE